MKKESERLIWAPQYWWLQKREEGKEFVEFVVLMVKWFYFRIFGIIVKCFIISDLKLWKCFVIYFGLKNFNSNVILFDEVYIIKLTLYHHTKKKKARFL
jgi:hypothetical protein